MTATLPATQFA